MARYVELPIGNEAVALVDAADLALVQGRSWWVRRGGRRRTAYAENRIGPMHRIIAGAEPGQVVDHINGNGLDNRRANLRICTQAENTRNRRRGTNNTAGFKGVHRPAKSSGYAAQLFIAGKAIRLGYFSTAIEAAVAYDRAAAEHFGEFARLNFSSGRDWILPDPVPRNQRGRTSPQR